MKIFFSQAQASPDTIEEDLSPLDLKESIRKTRQALDIAYAGFDNALESDLIDSYIYEINALQKRYQGKSSAIFVGLPQYILIGAILARREIDLSGTP